jgi:hypothetical protein
MRATAKQPVPVEPGKEDPNPRAAALEALRGFAARIKDGRPNGGVPGEVRGRIVSSTSRAGYTGRGGAGGERSQHRGTGGK